APSAPLVTMVETPNFKHLGDFNGDGSSDLLFLQQNGTLQVVNIAGNQTAGTAFPGPVGPEWHLAGVQDFDHGGADELLYRRADGALQINQFIDNQATTVAHMIGQVGNEWNLAGFGDFNDDGTTDLLWQRTTDQMLMILDMQNNAVTSAT